MQLHLNFLSAHVKAQMHTNLMLLCIIMCHNVKLHANVCVYFKWAYVKRWASQK